MSVDTFRNAEGRKVVASDTADSIGQVKHFVLDAGGHEIDAIHVSGHGKRSVVLPWDSIGAFGADAVMATSATALAGIDDDRQKAAVKGVVAMLGTRVLTVEGREIGRVHDVEFDTDSGSVVRVLTDVGSVEASRVRSLGSYALVVDDGPLEATDRQVRSNPMRS